jgi:anti-sigma-K factor RskA
MNITRNPALVDQLAASYALGTLRGGARKRFEKLARVHASVRAAALLWQEQLASVTELQPDITPGPAVWTRINNLIQAEKQTKAMQTARLLVQSPVSWWASLSLWRGASAVGTLAAVAALFMVGNLSGLNQTLGQQVSSLGSEVKSLSIRLDATPEIRYVAVLADDKAAASMLVTFDAKRSQLLLKRVGAFQEQPDKSLQLWALPEGGAPKSMGVMGRDAILRMTIGNSDMASVPMLAVTLEVKGGVPEGSGPKGPLLFKGALLKTVL